MSDYEAMKFWSTLGVRLWKAGVILTLLLVVLLLVGSLS